MANAVGFEGANSIMQAPVGVASHECLDLPVFRDQSQIISCWRLTGEELETIKKTGVVWLSISGQGMPPVYIGAKDVLHVDGRESTAEPYIKPAKRINNAS